MSPWERVLATLQHRHVVVRMASALLAAVALCVIFRAWNPPFAYRTGSVPSSDIVAAASFAVPDPQATKDARDLARSRVRCVFIQNPEPLMQLRELVRNKVVELTSAATVDKVDPHLWREFQPSPADELPSFSRQQEEERFAGFKEMLASPEKLAKFEKQLAAAMAPFETRGLLGQFSREPGSGSFEEILVHPAGQTDKAQVVKVADVLIGDGNAVFQSLQKSLDSADLADRVFAFMRPRLRDTLTLDEAETKRALDEAAAGVADVPMKIESQARLARAGRSLDRRDVHFLELEYGAVMARRTWNQQAIRASAVVMILFVLLMLCSVFMRFRLNVTLSSKQWGMMLTMLVLTASTAYFASSDWCRAEIIPVLLLGMIAAIAFQREMALLLCGVLAVIVTIGNGQELSGFIQLAGISSLAVLQLGQIRSRPKLIYVGLISGGAAVLLTLITGIIDNPALDVAPFGDLGRSGLTNLIVDAGRVGLWTLSTGFLMTGLLPFIENAFGVLTDLSLLELGDVAHPLLQELVRRAPATYNHSITVGSIAEAAAESIGARGLLVRVGAYFHDIGKMLKPGYFVENQGTESSRHEALLPTMSTLVIFAHVKDGADLGRQRHLPKPIIDLIEQHHGTTLVEFFYGRANEQHEADPTGAEVDESSYRYPGPKPQTKEAGVLMLADAVEGASRSLIDPTPARIESLVCEMAERRLQDGQFDESGLTLRELRTIQRSLAKSLTALYHGRIKYPEARTNA
jgi:putative nucleotidyltransferase with HDIG domain